MADVGVAMNISSIKIESYDYCLTEDEREYLSQSRSESTFKAGSIVLVNDKMQKEYVYELKENPGQHFDPSFTPFFSPKDMLEYGVFEGKYCNDSVVEFPYEWFADARIIPFIKHANFFGVKSRMSLSEWRDRGWIHEVDPRGWFQWYMRYYLGRRIPVYDDAQIKRWKAFKRHEMQVKINAAGEVLKRLGQRQALLQWAYNPFA